MNKMSKTIVVATERLVEVTGIFPTTAGRPTQFGFRATIGQFNTSDVSQWSITIVDHEDLNLITKPLLLLRIRQHLADHHVFDSGEHSSELGFFYHGSTCVDSRPASVQYFFNYATSKKPRGGCQTFYDESTCLEPQDGYQEFFDQSSCLEPRGGHQTFHDQSTCSEPQGGDQDYQNYIK